ncbi:MAG: tyrosine-type recombinase/integrase [Gemmatimonadales bacterium]
MIRAGMSIARQYGVLMWLKIFLKFCREYLKVAVLDPAEVRLPRRPEPNVAYLTKEEVARVVHAIPVHTLSGNRLRALVELLLGTGLRISEALAFPREPFDTRQPMVAIVGKVGRRRNVHLTDRVFRWVQLYLDARRDQLPQLFVTTGDRPTKWARADISLFFRRLRSGAQLTKPLTPHILRHTSCTTLLHNGVDIRF